MVLKKTDWTLRRIVYRDGAEEFEGLFFDGKDMTLPLVILFHEYLGMEQHIIDKAMELAKEGFKVFVADLYGRNIKPKNHNEAYPHYRFLKENPLVMEKRSRLAVFQAETCLNSQHHAGIALLGFSMGGWAALALAQSSLDIRLAISVYGYLNTLTHMDCVSCDLLIIHGLKDKIVLRKDLVAFLDLAENLGKNCEVVLYSSVGHGFCNPSLEPDLALGNFYDQHHFKRSWHRIVGALKQYKE